MNRTNRHHHAKLRINRLAQLKHDDSGHSGDGYLGHFPGQN